MVSIGVLMLCFSVAGWGKEPIYSEKDLNVWRNVEKPIMEKYPSLRKVYEFMDEKHDVAFKIFTDLKTSKAFLIFWGENRDISCKKNGEKIPKVGVIFPYEVEIFLGSVMYDSDGGSEIVEDHKTVTRTEIGGWMKLPKDESLTIILKSKTAQFSVLWNAGESLPEVAFKRLGAGP